MATPEKPHPFDTMLSFGKFVPGFDFLQGLMNNADKSLPAIGQWVAPTLDPQELDKRINDLKAVHFWLEQNGRMLAATIQALEVQRMTLSTLQTMNVNMADLREAMKVSSVPAEKAAATAAPPAAAEPAPKPAKAQAKSTDNEAAVPKPAVDAMEWWGALTQQFSHLAHNAVNESFKGVPGAAPSAGATAGAAPKKPASKRPAGKAAKPAAKPARAPRRTT